MSITTNTATFQPIVSIGDGVFETHWDDSFVEVVDPNGVEVIDDFDTGDKATELLDERLAAIRAVLDGNTSELALLVRPFFEEVRP